MKYINIINIIFIIIIKKKANENISQGADNFKEFSIVYSNPKPEFVRIKQGQNYNNLKQIIEIMRTLAFEGVDGYYEYYLYILCLSNKFKFILT